MPTAWMRFGGIDVFMVDNKLEISQELFTLEQAAKKLGEKFSKYVSLDDFRNVIGSRLLKAHLLNSSNQRSISLPIKEAMSPGTEADPKLPMPAQKTILIVAANPSNETRLRLDVEARDIGEGLRLSKHRDQFVLKQQWATRVRDLRRAMQEHQPSIVHFCGHGTGERGIVLEDNDGKTRFVSTEALANFFELFTDEVECVVLNACFSEVQAKAIVQHIPYVMGMSEGIGDKAAIEFAVAFYDSLAAGKDFEKAYRFGCNAIELAGVTGHLIPQLYKKSDLSPTATHSQQAIIFNIPIPRNPFFTGRSNILETLHEALHKRKRSLPPGSADVSSAEIAAKMASLPG